MKKLYNFIYKNNFFFVFLVLEIICFLILSRNSGYQGSSLFNSSNRVAASIYETTAEAKEYLLLKDENERIAKENAILHNQLKSSFAALPLSVYTKNDTLYKEQYRYVSAKAVNNSVNKRSNYITLNIGSQQGIARDMAVINSNGIVGVVKDVSGNFASCMSILHKDVRVNCELKKDHSFGPLSWDGSDYRYATLSEIPTSTPLKPGDTIITSNLSGIFPEGIMVGTVESWEKRQNESFNTIKVKLSADFKKVNHVYVIKYIFKNEKDSLEQTTQVQGDK